MTNNQEISEEEARSYLSFYVADPERLDAYIARLHSAPSLKEVERILVAMVRAEGIPTDILTCQEFYMTVRVFFAHLKAGRSTLHEHFVNIQSAAKAKTSSAGSAEVRPFRRHRDWRSKTRRKTALYHRTGNHNFSRTWRPPAAGWQCSRGKTATDGFRQFHQVLLCDAGLVIIQIARYSHPSVGNFKKNFFL